MSTEIQNVFLVRKSLTLGNLAIFKLNEYNSTSKVWSEKQTELKSPKYERRVSKLVLQSQQRSKNEAGGGECASQGFDSFTTQMVTPNETRLQIFSNCSP